MEKCPICESQVQGAGPVANRDMTAILCPVCGRFSISPTAQMALGELVGERHLLIGALREASDNAAPLEVLTTTIDYIISSAAPPDGPFGAMDEILLKVYEKMESADAWATVPAEDFPTVYAHGVQEFDFLLNKLVERGLLEVARDRRYRLTLDGWEYVGELRSRLPDSTQAFVAMWFDDETAQAWSDGFVPALEAVGYAPFRIDLLEHIDKIDDKIIAEIRKSGLLIGDFTGGRGGVYFEAGFALGLGIPVIWTCRQDWIEKLHFDTRQYNHIVWEEPADLRGKLINRIEATLPSRRRRRFAGPL